MNNARASQFLLIFISVSGCFSVLFGAWLAHAGQSLALVEQQRLFSAQLYQFLHTIVLFGIWLAIRQGDSKRLLFTAFLFILGIFAFSGSLYAKTFFAWQAVGKFAPVGGMSLALGWLSLLAILIRVKSK